MVGSMGGGHGVGDGETLQMADQASVFNTAGGRKPNKDRKTVTFGDSSAVRSDARWSFVSLVGLVVLWYVTTRPWGLDEAFKSAELSDAERITACNQSDDCGRDSYTQILGPLTFPSIRDTWNAFGTLATEGFRGPTLLEHVWASLWRVIRGMFWGIVVGVPVGFAMGLSNKARGFFDTIVELFRPIPPLALIPLFILMFGIGFFRLDVVVAGIIVIAVLGVMMDLFLRFLESKLIPWRGKG